MSPNKQFIVFCIHASEVIACGNSPPRALKLPDHQSRGAWRKPRHQFEPRSSPSLPTSWHSLTIPTRDGFSPSFSRGYSPKNTQVAKGRDAYSWPQPSPKTKRAWTTYLVHALKVSLAAPTPRDAPLPSCGHPPYRQRSGR